MAKTFGYYVHTIDLTTARLNSELACGLMNTLLVNRIDDINSNLTIRFETSSGQAITLRAGDTYNFSNIDLAEGSPPYFEKVFITNTAVGAGSAELVFAYNIEIKRLLRITADVVQEGVLQQVVAMGVVAAPIPAVALQSRINLLISNQSAVTVYVGSATVTAAGAAQGIPILAGGTLSLNISDSVVLYGILAAGAANINILEGS